MLGERHGSSLCVISGVSCNKRKAGSTFCHKSMAYTLLCLERSWTESLKLQSWRSLLANAWSQYLR